jgi:hypothetical protein
MTGRVALLEIIQHLFFVDVDQHPAFDGFPQPGTLDLARLEDNVAIRQDDWQSLGAKMRDDIERAGI